MVAEATIKVGRGKGAEKVRLPPLRLTPSQVHRDVYILVGELRRPKNQHGRPRPPPAGLHRSTGAGSVREHSQHRQFEHTPTTTRMCTSAEVCGRDGHVAPGALTPAQCVQQWPAEGFPPPVTLRRYQARRRPASVQVATPAVSSTHVDYACRSTARSDAAACGLRMKEEEMRTEERVDAPLRSEMERAAIAAVVRELVQDDDADLHTNRTAGPRKDSEVPTESEDTRDTCRQDDDIFATWRRTLSEKRVQRTQASGTEQLRTIAIWPPQPPPRRS